MGQNFINGHDKTYASIIHIDRLEFTLKIDDFSSFIAIRNPDAIPASQKYGSIELILDRTIGSTAYYHSHHVYFYGKKVGRLHTASKRGKKEVEFNFEKHVLYSNEHNWWYAVYQELCKELGLSYNNIKYIEISLDSEKPFTTEYGYLYTKSENFIYHKVCYYKTVRNVKPEILEGGNGFRISGEDNRIHLYDKSGYAEDFILDFLRNNGLPEKVYRIESRLNWNYLKSLINRKHFVITPETLLDEGMLSTLFDISVKNKLSFYDLRTKKHDHNRNPKYTMVSVLDDIILKKSELLKYFPGKQYQHYKNDNSDEEIIRRTYFQYIQTGNRKYFKNIRNAAEAACMDETQVLNLIRKFNIKYRGDRTNDILHRMDETLGVYQKIKSAKSFKRFFTDIGKNLLEKAERKFWVLCQFF